MEKRPNGISDERLQLLNLSLGIWMLRIVDLIQAGGPFD
jgi:hypothetical protein